MKLHTDIKILSVAGFGPAAWDQDTQKVSMHPPLPGHIEYVEEEMQLHAAHKKHHVMHRDNPENHHEETLIRDVPPQYLKKLLSGKYYLKQPLSAQALRKSSSVKDEKEREDGDLAESVVAAEPA